MLAGFGGSDKLTGAFNIGRLLVDGVIIGSWELKGGDHSFILQFFSNDFNLGSFDIFLNLSFKPILISDKFLLISLTEQNSGVITFGNLIEFSIFTYFKILFGGCFMQQRSLEQLHDCSSLTDESWI